MSMTDGLQDLRVTDIAWKGEGFGNVRFGQQGSRVVQFYNRPMHNPIKSANEGRHVYDDRIYFKSYEPGEQRFEIVDRPATDSDKRNYPMQWNAFVTNQKQTPEGTPIDHLYPEKPSIAATLQAYGVQTIEQCAALGATAIDNIGMGCQMWVNDATKYIEVAKKGVSVTQFRREKEQLEGKIRVLEQQVQTLMSEVQSARANATNQIDPGMLQQALAGLMARPGMPTASPQMSKTFDAQTAQINATHATAEVTRQKRTRTKKAAG